MASAPRQTVVVCSPADATMDLLFDLTFFLASWCLAHTVNPHSLRPVLGSRASCYAMQRTVASATQGRNDMGLLSPGPSSVFGGPIRGRSLIQAWMGHLQTWGREERCVCGAHIDMVVSWALPWRHVSIIE